MPATSAHLIADELDARTIKRIRRLRLAAADAISEANDLEATLPDSHEHPRCPTCEGCRLEIVADAVRMGYAK